MEETIDKLTFIGIKDQNKIKTFLKTKDPCFGKAFKKQEKVCQQCRAPVLLNNDIYLLRDVCKTLTKDEQEPVKIKNITSNQVLTKIKSGIRPEDILKELVGTQPSFAEVKEARSLLSRRLSYLKTKKNLPVPSLSSVKEIWDSEF